MTEVKPVPQVMPEPEINKDKPKEQPIPGEFEKELEKEIKKEKLCAYDIGYGLVISEYIGDSVDASDRISGDKFRIKTPEDGPNWDARWEAQRKLINEMVNAYNEKYNL